jgi:hypothetical protein
MDISYRVVVFFPHPARRSGGAAAQPTLSQRTALPPYNHNERLHHLTSMREGVLFLKVGARATGRHAAAPAWAEPAARGRGGAPVTLRGVEYSCSSYRGFKRKGGGIRIINFRVQT